MKVNMLLLFSVLLFSVNFNTLAQDVIFFNSGEVLHAKVTEIKLETAHYIRSDNMEGPVYEVPLYLIYAIAYGANQRTEYYNVLPPANQNSFLKRHHKNDSTKLGIPALLNPSIWLGLGFGKGYSRAEDGREFITPDGGSPTFVLTFSAEVQPNLHLGIQFGTSGYNFEGSSLNNYDSLLLSDRVRENVTTLGFFGKYQKSLGVLKPYLLGGLALNMSKVVSEREVNLLVQDQVLLINNTARYANLGITLRIGLQYEINPLLSLYSDVGTGISVLQLGGVFSLPTAQAPESDQTYTN